MRVIKPHALVSPVLTLLTTFFVVFKAAQAILLHRIEAKMEDECRDEKRQEGLGEGWFRTLKTKSFAATWGEFCSVRTEVPHEASQHEAGGPTF